MRKVLFGFQKGQFGLNKKYNLKKGEIGKRIKLAYKTGEFGLYIPRCIWLGEERI